MTYPTLKFKVAAVALGACLLLAFGLRLYQLDSHSLWYDELLQLDVAQADATAINARLTRHAAMPLDYWLLHGWILLGRQDAWVRLPALFFGVLSVALLYALARRMMNSRRVGVLSAALLAGSFFAIRFSREARPYSLLLFLTLLTFLGLWQFSRSHRARDGLLFVAGLAGAALTHYFALFLLPPIALFLLVSPPARDSRRRFRRRLALLGLALLAVLLVFTLSGRFWKLYSVGQRFVREAGRPALYTLPATAKPNGGSGPPVSVDFFAEKILMPLSSLEPATLLVFNLFLLAGLVWLLRQKHRRGAALFLLGWLVLPAALIYLFLLHRGTFFASRYILFVLPPYLMLAACGIDAAAGRLSGALGRAANNPRTAGLQTGLSLALLLPLLLAQGVAWQAWLNAGPREDWRAAAQLLRQNAAPGDFVAAVNAAETLDWYLPGVQTSPGRFGHNRVFWQAVRGYSRHWFVLSSYSRQVGDQALRDWLEQHGAVKIPLDRRVTVYFHADGQTRAQMLAQAARFNLPAKPLPLVSLADQLAARGQTESAADFYRRAAALARHLPPPTPLSVRAAALR